MSRDSALARRRRRKFARVFGVVAFMVVFVAAVAIVAGWYALIRDQNSVVAGKPVHISVPVGAGSEEIASLLTSKGVVRNANMFRLQTRLAKADGKLRAGEYDLKTGMPDEVVIDRLLAGPVVKYIKVTVPEGFVIEQIADRLQDKAGIPREEFLALAKGGAAEFEVEHPAVRGAYAGSLEGYLFPKTYQFKEGTTARQAVEIMLDQFDKEIAAVDVARARSRGVTLPELVTIASMIERETKLPKERVLVSSVIYNRLDRKMRLQMCSTIEYILRVRKLRLTNADIQTQSPYNTYLHDGLPPGPIASPGLASLQAAAQPADTDYIYYVLTGKDGSHTFAGNDSDFQKAKRKSKEVFGQ